MKSKSLGCPWCAALTQTSKSVHQKIKSIAEIEIRILKFRLEGTQDCLKVPDPYQFLLHSGASVKDTDEDNNISRFRLSNFFHSPFQSQLIVMRLIQREKSKEAMDFYKRWKKNEEELKQISQLGDIVDSCTEDYYNQLAFSPYRYFPQSPAQDLSRFTDDYRPFSGTRTSPDILEEDKYVYNIDPGSLMPDCSSDKDDYSAFCPAKWVQSLKGTYNKYYYRVTRKLKNSFGGGGKK